MSVVLAKRSAKVRLSVFLRSICVMILTIAEITGTKAPKIAVCNFDILINLLSQCLFCISGVFKEVLRFKLQSELSYEKFRSTVFFSKLKSPCLNRN